ncbi:hypothetical protein Fmac_003157 [Flemingia macrophylla]|uniref:Uncharacterized protein n=1 Tax=Flemingia macrophylla TaxID=520843 RepID=A0ABD1NNE2_9FABA
MVGSPSFLSISSQSNKASFFSRLQDSPKVKLLKALGLLKRYLFITSFYKIKTSHIY